MRSPFGRRGHWCWMEDVICVSCAVVVVTCVVVLAIVFATPIR